MLWALTLDKTVRQEPAPAADGERRAAYVLMFIGALLLLRSLGIWSADGWVWPGMALSFGIAFLMDRGDIDPRSAILGLFDPDSGRFRARTATGVVLLVIGVSILANVAAPAVGTVMLAVLTTGIGMAVLFGPWVWKLAADLGAERRKRIRQEERADMAAHLHDSVLQTLALIQRTEDPRRMVTLARVQERELRRWLYDTTPADGPELLSAALQEEADRVEHTFDVRIQLVTVGDRPVDDEVRAIIAATGESLTNAARHSGTDRISVYSEVGRDATDVWISESRGRVRPDRGGRRPSRNRRVHTRSDGEQGRHRHRLIGAGRRHRDPPISGRRARMIRVFLVDDHRLFLSGVRAELADPDDIDLIGTAGDVDDAIDALRLDPPDVALVDVHMPGGGGLAILDNVLQTHPQVKFLALSVSDAAEDVIAMIRAGARGYVTKSIRPEALVDAIRRVHAGDAVFSPMLAGFVLDNLRRHHPGSGGPRAGSADQP